MLLFEQMCLFQGLGVRKGASMSRSASDLLDPVQYESSSDLSQVYFASAINPVTVGATMRPAKSSSNLLHYQTTGRHPSNSHSSRNNSCTSDDESLANTVYSRQSTSSSYLSTSNTSKKMAQHQCSNGGSGDSCHKIAVCNPPQGATAPHVSTILVTPAQFRTERDALSRLDQLSCQQSQVR